MNLNLLYFLVISILIFYYFNNKEYFTNEDDIYLKIFRRSHPWSKGLIKNNDINIKLDIQDRKRNKKTITSILMSRCLYKFDNKLYLSQFLKDKQYYPKTYIYNKNNKYIPDDNNTWFIKKCAYGSYGGKDIFVANNYNGIRDNLNSNGSYLIQKAVSDLYLFNGFKGDIRMHYLVFLYKNKLNFYLFKDGHIKLAKNKFDNSNVCTDVQLTNVSQVGENELARSLYFSQKYENYDPMFFKIKSVLTDLSNEIKKDFPKKYKSFYALEYQLCGPDIIFDNNMNPYLLELNTNFPAYVMKKDINQVKATKRYLADVLTNQLFKKAVNNEDINLEEYGFVKLL
tara:strand:+ start:1197 stop:2219 length:1023 start_codon:yes stop_codon:yes gene_type:complete